MPRRAMRCSVTMKLSPVRIDENPVMKIARAAGDHIVSTTPTNSCH